MCLLSSFLGNVLLLLVLYLPSATYLLITPMGKNVAKMLPFTAISFMIPRIVYLVNGQAGPVANTPLKHLWGDLEGLLLIFMVPMSLYANCATMYPPPYPSFCTAAADHLNLSFDEI